MDLSQPPHIAISVWPARHCPWLYCHWNACTNHSQRQLRVTQVLHREAELNSWVEPVSFKERSLWLVLRKMGVNAPRAESGVWSPLNLRRLNHPRLCAQEPHLLGLQSQLCTTSAAWPRGSHSIFLETAFPYLSEGIFIALS